MNVHKSFLKRLLIVSIPLLSLYYFSEMVFKANREREHPTDAGLGIAILLFFILLIFFVGFTVDTIIRFRQKQYQIAMVNAIFLSPFLFFILYIATLFSGGPFYDFFKKLHNQEFIYIGIIYLILISFGLLVVYKYSFKKTLIYLLLFSSVISAYFYNKYNINNHYKKNKDIYYDGKINDTIIAIGSDSMSVLSLGQIDRKSWNRVYIKTKDDAVELNEWIKPIARKYNESIRCKFYNENN